MPWGDTSSQHRQHQHISLAGLMMLETAGDADGERVIYPLVVWPDNLAAVVGIVQTVINALKLDHM